MKTLKTLFKRGISTVLLLFLFSIVIFGSSLSSQIVFAVLAVYFSAAGTWEFCSLAEAAGYRGNRFLASFCSGLTVLLILLKEPLYAGMVSFLLIVFSWILLLFSENRKEKLGNIATTDFCYFIMILPCAAIVSVYAFSFSEVSGLKLLLYLILVTKAGDIGAYLVGTLCNAVQKGGNHKMIPSISPGKSYEGAFGGLLFSMGVSVYLMKYCGISDSLYAAAAAGVLFFFGGMAGDLAESSLKRMGGVKDSGGLLPGIGGVLDLIDSLMINGVIFFLCLVFSGKENIFPGM